MIEKREKAAPLWKSSLIVNFMISMIVHLPLRGYVSVNSMPDHPPGDPRGFAHSSCPWGRIFAPLSCPGVCLGVLNQSKSSITLKKSAIFALSLKQMSSSSFHMFIYARSEQCDLGPIY